MFGSVDSVQVKTVCAWNILREKYILNLFKKLLHDYTKQRQNSYFAEMLQLEELYK